MGASLDIGLCSLFHTLTEGEEMELALANSLLFNKSLNFRLWIRSRTENEHNWCFLSGLLEDLLVHDRGRLHIELIATHLGNNESLDGVDHTIWSEDPNQEQALKLVFIFLDFLRVAHWKNSFLRLFQIVPLTPDSLIIFDVFEESGPAASKFSKLNCILPSVS